MHWIDYLIVFLIIGVIIAWGVSFKNKTAKNLNSFFLGGRNIPWYVAGISMVATTFAADTPLAITELIHTSGISGNWIWWNMLLSGTLTVFLFSKLWRRANILTELEFIEFRYQGKAARWLRMIKAVYLGLFMNTIVIAWVNVAMITILEIFFGITFMQALGIVILFMLLTLVYSAISGLKAVVYTDVIQFVIAIVCCIILAYFVLDSDKVGGIAGLKEKLPKETFSFFPKINGKDAFSITGGAFITFLAVQWWSSWFPGAEPGGGGYISQRMMSTKNEKDAILSTLLFQILHYCLRPWPWILVGLAALILYPDLTDETAKEGYVMAMNDFMPTGLKGLMLAGFLGAYMSTISTQINWGASYLTNDFYKLIYPNKKNYIGAAQIISVIIAIVSIGPTLITTSIKSTWEFLIASGAGLGAVLILRWYWWRINVWSEISATIAPLFFYAISSFLIPELLTELQYQDYVANKGHLIFTSFLTCLVWLIVTLKTPPEETDHLLKFYDRVKPGGCWKPIREMLNLPKVKDLRYLMGLWLVSTVLIYSVLFVSGYLIFQEWNSALIGCLVIVLSGSLFWYLYKKANL